MLFIKYKKVVLYVVREREVNIIGTKIGEVEEMSELDISEFMKKKLTLSKQAQSHNLLRFTRLLKSCFFTSRLKYCSK